MLNSLLTFVACLSLVASDWIIVEQTESRIVMVRPTNQESLTLWDGESGGRLIAGAEWSTDARSGDYCMTGTHSPNVFTNPTVWPSAGNDIAIGEFDTLSFWVRADRPQRLGVKMRCRYDEDDSPKHSGEVFIDVTTEWDEFRIPRTSFQNDMYDAQRVDHISFTVKGTADRAFTFWVDDIAMLNIAE